MIEDNEDIYDDEIAPLMAQIIAICKLHEMPMFATFEYAPGDFCTTAIPVDVAPIDPRTAGMTHHQGRGRIGAITRSSSFSIRNGFSIPVPPGTS